MKRTGHSRQRISIVLILMLCIVNAWAEPFELESDPDGGVGLSAWVKLGTEEMGWCDYDGKVSAEDTFIIGGNKIFYGWANADVAKLGGGSVSAIAAKYCHDTLPPFEDTGLADQGGSLGMMSNVIKPFTITSDTLGEGTATECTLTVSYDGLILLREEQAGEYCSGQVDFSVDLLDAIGEGEDDESIVMTTEGEEFMFSGQLRIEDALGLDGTTHTYTEVDDMAPEVCVNLDFPDEADDNYWNSNPEHVTIAVIDPQHPDQFTVLQGALDAVPADIQDSIANNPEYQHSGNKIYYVVFSKTATFNATIGQTYWFNMDMQSAAQTSLGAGMWEDLETFVVCDFSRTAAYSMVVDGAEVRTLIDISGDAVLGGGTAQMDGAVMQWSDDADLANGITLLNGNTTLMDTQEFDGSVGAVDGTGNLLKLGTGTLSLDENCTFDGDTVVREGGMVVNGSYGSDVLVNGGWLGGGGTLGGGLSLTSGSVRPGNSIGTLTVDTFTLDGGTLEVELDDAGNADRIDATTAELVSGTVRAAPTEPITEIRNYTIVQTTDGITGSADDLQKAISNQAYLLDFDLALSGDENDLILTARQSRDFSETAAAAGGSNLASLTAALQGAADGGQGGSEMAALQLLGEAELNEAIEQMQPQVYQGSSQVLGRQTGAVHASTMGRIGAVQYASRHAEQSLRQHALADAGTGQLGEAMRAAAALPQMREGRWIGYSRSLNDWGEADGDENAAGYRWQTHGVDVGAETFAADNTLVGASVTALWSGVHGFDSSGSSDITSVYGNLYASWFSDAWHVDAGVSYGHAWTETTRPIMPLGLRAEGDFESDIYSAFLGGGLFYDVAGYEVEPFALFQYTLRSDGGYEESEAGGLGLDLNRNETDSLRQTLGVRVSRMLTLENGTKLRPFASAAWDYEYLDDQIVGSADLLGQGFRNAGAEVSRHSGIFSGGVDWYVRSNITLFGDYTALINSDVTVHSVNTGIRITF